ncbi:MAG TPA: 3D domain-containing protein [Pyrinomonadaceae bacterium]|nr:3D domain-containing protein [Pyrinomonadaceae bacterium]
MKSFFSGSAIIASALLVGSLTFSAQPLAAETPFHQQAQNPKQDVTTTELGGVIGKSSSALTGAVVESTVASEQFVAAAAPYVATAYTLRGRTASGRLVGRGLIAADPRVLPLGSRVRLEAGTFSGEYLVADTGGAVRGKRIDIWTPSNREAFRFGRRTVKLTVLSYGPKRIARKAKR